MNIHCKDRHKQARNTKLAPVFFKTNTENLQEPTIKIDNLRIGVTCVYFFLSTNATTPMLHS